MSLHAEQLHGDAVFVIHGFLSPEECDQHIAASEQIGYEEATIHTAAGHVMKKSVRDNTRVTHDDPALATRLFERARLFLPEAIGRWHLASFNERWRYYRYDVGQRFARHSDGIFKRDEWEHSELTFMVYLNDDFLGGETNFYLSYGADPEIVVRPERGKALVFVHAKLHEGAPILEGRKYVLRTDIMYRRHLDTK